VVVFHWTLLWLVACEGTVSPRSERDGGLVARDGFVSPLADAGAPCPSGEHRCGDGCVSSTDVASCGDRCVPCPAVENGAATCEGACGLACDPGFFECLGRCLPDAEAPCSVSLEPNEFSKITDWQMPGGDTGPRNYAAMHYAAASDEYVLVGGTLAYERAPRPYDVQALRLGEAQWRNHHPPGTAWGPDVGNSSAPLYSHEGWAESDPDGVARPNWQLYPGAKLYYQHAFDPDRARFFFYLWNHTFAYDVAERSYSFFEPAIDPGAGPESPRLLWSAMAYDAVDDKILLFGGANTLTDGGAPGTWIYEVATNTWRKVEGPEPGPRALSPLVTDPDTRKALLFGGDELDRLLSDTWAFDFATETWAELTPAAGPAPRAGHQLLFLPTSRRTVMLGGYGYGSSTDYVASHTVDRPLELWRFDFSPPSWQLVRRWNEDETQPEIDIGSNHTFAAAAGAGDVVLMQFKNGYAGALEGSETWAIRVDPTAIDAAGTSVHSVIGGSVEARASVYDPAWYTEGVPSPDPAAFAASLDALPENVWNEIEVPNRPAHNHDWGTAAIDPVRQVLLRFSGGHSAHSGTEVLEYDMRTNRYSIGFAPEIPIDFEYSNDQVPGQWSFDANPWMMPHTYKTYAYGAAFGRMVLVKDPYTYTYDLETHDWDRDPVRSVVGGSQYTNVVVPTPTGMMLYNPEGLWDLDVTTRRWEALPVRGEPLPAVSPDQNVAVWDSARGRLLLFSSVVSRGQIWSYDPSTGDLSALDPMGRAAMDARSDSFHREAVYLPSLDVVVLATFVDDATPVYHCAENRWYAYDLGELQRELYGVSVGLVADARDRLWAVETASRVMFAKLDPASALRSPL
jgi:hypothetical protein